MLRMLEDDDGVATDAKDGIEACAMIDNLMIDVGLIIFSGNAMVDGLTQIGIGCGGRKDPP